MISPMVKNIAKKGLRQVGRTEVVVVVLGKGREPLKKLLFGEIGRKATDDDLKQRVFCDSDRTTCTTLV